MTTQEYPHHFYEYCAIKTPFHSVLIETLKQTKKKHLYLLYMKEELKLVSLSDTAIRFKALMMPALLEI